MDADRSSTHFSHDRGFYDAPFAVTITADEPSALIRYTTDASTPSRTRGQIYNGPVPISSTTILRVIAYTPTATTNVDTVTYIFPDDVIRQRKPAGRRETLGPQNPALAPTRRTSPDERIELLSSFRYSGFSVDATPTVWPSDGTGIERIGRYLLRCPNSLERIHWTPGAKTLFYQGKLSHDDNFASDPQGEILDIFEFLARLLTQIPEPRRHGMHYFGAYSSRARTRRKEQGRNLETDCVDHHEPPSFEEPKLCSKERTALRRRWANLIRRVFQDRPSAL